MVYNGRALHVYADVDQGAGGTYSFSLLSKREVGIGTKGKGSKTSKDSVGLPGEALLCIRSTWCSTAVCAL